MLEADFNDSREYKVRNKQVDHDRKVSSIKDGATVSWNDITLLCIQIRHLEANQR